MRIPGRDPILAKRSPKLTIVAKALTNHSPKNVALSKVLLTCCTNQSNRRTPHYYQEKMFVA
jgi:hypothetical protein